VYSKRLVSAGLLHRIAIPLCAAAWLTAPARAEVELSVHFTALKRMLADAVFTQEGRRYVRGTKDNRCNFAYLENPDLEAGDGRLRVKARFTGRTALDVFGRCVGLGDAFDVRITGTPQYRDGFIGLRDVSVDPSGRDSFYIRRVSAALKRSLERDFRYPAAEEARRAFEASSSPAYRRQLGRFNVTAIRVASDALVLTLDFALSVR
jgi:hypothetical protein